MAARPGRLLRQIMADRAADSPERAAERIRARQAGECAIADREAKFPVLTADNAGDAMAYQAEQQRFHEARLADLAASQQVEPDPAGVDYAQPDDPGDIDEVDLPF